MITKPFLQIFLHLYGTRLELILPVKWLCLFAIDVRLSAQ